MDLNFIRSHFPALQKPMVFMDNAGGSQALSTVAERIKDYFMNFNVQLGASYETSAMAGKKLDEVHTVLAGFINAHSPKEIVIGPSTTMLLRILSICISRQWKPGDEVIVTNSDHEANVSPWNDLKDKGIVVKIWKLNPVTLEFDLDDLKKLISNKTRLVAMVHASNILGTINPVAEIAQIVHNAGALICLDGVAFAPHRLVDVQALDVDFYVFSTYKVYGPHQAIMYGKLDLLKQVDGLNHYFVGKEDVPYKFQPGNFNFELTYSLQAIPEYFQDVYNHHYSSELDLSQNQKYAKAFELVAKHEEQLSEHLLDYLNQRKDIKIIGKSRADMLQRVPTISFVHQSIKSSAIVEKIDKFGIGIRYGDFYAKKLIEDAGLVEKDGVVRISMVHYNTLDEVNQLIVALDQVLG